ncbi:MAG TPA: NBR1-Ig-like domain-containing protein [Anaerolineaceae bacterium]
MTARWKRNIFCLGMIFLLAGCMVFDGQNPSLQKTEGMPPYQTVSFILTETDVARITTKTQQAGTPLPTLTQGRPTNQTATPGIDSTAMCDRAFAGKPFDLTIPDNTPVRAGSTFTKTWRLVNQGSCTWTREYAAVWFSGTKLSVANEIPISGTISPGQSVDISVDMVAPELPGMYMSNWKLRNAKGVYFGIGPKGDSPFWVKIIVLDLNPPQATATPLQPTPTATPAIFLTGKTTLQLNNRLDVDTGQMDSKTGSDFGLFLLENKRLYLAPLNEARIAWFGNQQPGFLDCRKAVLGQTTIPLDTVPDGGFACYSSNLGLPGRIKLSAIDIKNSTMIVEWVTWAVP